MSGVSLRVRLTLWYTLALLVVLALFAADVLWVQSRIGLRRVDRELDGLVTTLTNVIHAELAEQVSLETAAEEARSTVAADGRAVAIFDARGRPLAASWSGLALDRWLSSAQRRDGVWTEATPGGGWRLHARSPRFEAMSLTFLVGSTLADVEREQHEVREAMMVGVPIVLLLAGGGGLWLAAVGLRPISAMAQQAARLSLTGTEDLGEADRGDELGQFAGAFNGLVARLRAALQIHRQFMADASHELRTPVSIVRTAAEVTLSRDRRDEREYRDALSIVGDQARRLGRLVEDMLVLARADAGGRPLRIAELYLDELVADCCRAVDVLAAERGVTMVSAAGPEMPFRGDEDLLRQMLVNVLQNAVQHTPPGGAVTITLGRKDGEVSIGVRDTGAGIPAGDRERIFDRFVQLDPARRGRGAGLGLPIARWIAEAHGGTLALESSGPAGSMFRVTLPEAGASDIVFSTAHRKPALT
ncbi:MAG: HAMP domain-containing sensor histidine kinase [Acidobacteriota bacterium]